MSRTASSRLAVMGAAALFSTGGAAIKFCSLAGWQVACFRSGVAAVAIALFLPRTRRGWTAGTLLVACAYAATLISFVVATKLTTAANAIFLQATAPLYMFLLSPWLLREKVGREDVLTMAALAAGMILFFTGEPEPARASAPRPLLGNMVAVASGISYALLITGMRWLARGVTGRDHQADAAAAPAGAAEGVMLAGNLMAFAACLPLALPIPSLRPADVATLGYLGIFQIGLAYLLLTRGVRDVPALETSLLLLVEPVLNPFWAWLAQGERPGARAVAGGALIVTATAARTWRDATLARRRSALPM